MSPRSDLVKSTPWGPCGSTVANMCDPVPADAPLLRGRSRSSGTAPTNTVSGQESWTPQGRPRLSSGGPTASGSTTSSTPPSNPYNPYSAGSNPYSNASTSTHNPGQAPSQIRTGQQSDAPAPGVNDIPSELREDYTLSLFGDDSQRIDQLLRKAHLVLLGVPAHSDTDSKSFGDWYCAHCGADATSCSSVCRPSPPSTQEPNKN
jgi:hypothetical protein